MLSEFLLGNKPGKMQWAPEAPDSKPVVGKSETDGGYKNIDVHPTQV